MIRQKLLLTDLILEEKMKQIIVLLGMIVLGTFMVFTVTLGSTGSLKSDADSLGKEASDNITEFATDLEIDTPVSI